MKESDLHRQICKLLDTQGIVYFHSRTDKKTTQAKGVPDFVFSIRPRRWSSYTDLIAVAWECKIGKGKLSAEQAAMFDKLTRVPNAWRCAVIRSLDDAIKSLEELGL